MVKKRRTAGEASSIPAGMGMSVLLSAVLTLLGAAVCAYLLYAEMIQQESVGFVSMVVLAISSAVGALVAVNKIKRMRIQMCLLSGACYLVFLLCVTALFFGGQYEGVWINCVMILCGCGSVAVLGIMRKGDGKIRRRNKAYR